MTEQIAVEVLDAVVVVLEDEAIDITLTDSEVVITDIAPSGAPGVGLPAGGADGYVLAKASTTDYDFEWVAQAASGGDMTKAVYDPDNDGKVVSAGTADTANAVAWNNISGTPSSFTPSAHTHTISDVTSLQTALDGKAASSHIHAISDTTGLQTALDGKAATTHTHTISDVTSLQTALDGKAASSHIHAISDTTGLQTALDGKAASSHTHTASDITDFITAVDTRISASLIAGTTTIDMGNETTYGEITINNASIKADSVIIASVFGEEASIQQVTVSPVAIVDGVSATLAVSAPDGASGSFTIHYQIAA